MVFSNYFVEAKSGENRRKKKKRKASKSLGKRSRPSEDKSEARQKTRPSKKNKSPSEDALKLSQRLKELSRNKDLEGALKEYWHVSNDKIRDGHHACSVVDISARCGKIAEGEKIIKQMKESGKHVNVETLTALMKGYVHSGDITKAEKLFLSMCNAKGEYVNN
jgi:pentatricopeptide repeat protein